MKFTSVSLCTTLIAICISVNVATAQNDSAVGVTGFQQNRDYFSELPFENVDTFSGSLVLTFTDLVLPGNAGRELRFQRTYNSKTRGDGQWSFGVAGVVMKISDPLLPPVGTEVELVRTPTFFTTDGAEQRTTWLHQPVTGSQASIDSTLNWVSSSRFGRYNRAARMLYLPDGTICTYEAPSASLRRVHTCTDSFGNRVRFFWQSDSLVVRQLFSKGGADDEGLFRDVTFMYTGGVPTSMIFAGKTWTYNYTEPNEAGDVLLKRVEPPIGPAWEFDYVGRELTLLKTPKGGEIEYTFSTRTYLIPPARGAVPKEVSTRVVSQRATRDDGITTGTWTYSYDEHPEPGSACDDRPGSYTTITITPTATTIRYRHNIIPTGVLFPGTEWAVVTRCVMHDNVVLEREIRDYEPVPLLQDAPPGAVSAGDPQVPQVTRRVIERDGRAYITTYEFSAAHNGDYHNPSVITEIADMGSKRKTTREYTHSLTPFIVGLVKWEDVRLVVGEVEQPAFTKTWEYDLDDSDPGNDRGFVTGAVTYGIANAYSPDDFGNVASVTNGNGHTTSFAYEWGIPTSIQTPHHTTTRKIASDSTITWQEQAGRRTTFTYDPLLRLTKTDPPGPVEDILIEYDNETGRNVTTRRGSSWTRTSLDGFGRAIATRNSVNVRTTARYDAEGRKTYEGYPFQDGGSDIGTQISYDALGRVLVRDNPGPTQSTYTYGSGTLTIVDENGNATVHTRRGWGDPDGLLLTGVHDAEDQDWSYGYDALGQLTTVTAPDGIQRSWVYPQSNRLASETHPESGLTTYTYDNAGNLRTKRDAKQTEFVYDYDGNERLTGITATPNGGMPETATVAYEPGTDNRSRMTVPGLTTIFTYEPGTGRLHLRTDRFAGRQFSVQYEYDQNDRLSRLRYPSGRWVGYDYDNGNRITRVFDASAAPQRNYARGFEYHPSGAVTHYLTDGDLQHDFGFDANRYWPTTIDSGPLHLRYENYDGVGNVRRIVDTRKSQPEEFTYDKLDRLRTVSAPYAAITYAYDAHGNRRDAQGFSYAYHGNTLRLASQGNGQSVTSYGYDDNGNTTSINGQILTYSPHNMLRTVDNPVANYAYDADNWRVQKTTGGSTTFYIRGPGNQLLTEWTNPGSGSTFRDYIYADSRLIAVAKQ
jgi:YD repeat-containing protein